MIKKVQSQPLECFVTKFDLIEVVLKTLDFRRRMQDARH